jgi:hypothetical protein
VLQSHFAIVRGSARINFGVLQSRFAIVQGSAQIWDEETLRDTMTACIIMHNMIVENEGKVDPREGFPEGGDNVETSHEMMDFQTFIDNHVKIRNSDTCGSATQININVVIS